MKVSQKINVLITILLALWNAMAIFFLFFLCDLDDQIIGLLKESGDISSLSSFKEVSCRYAVGVSFLMLVAEFCLLYLENIAQRREIFIGKIKGFSKVPMMFNTHVILEIASSKADFERFARKHRLSVKIIEFLLTKEK